LRNFADVNIFLK